MRSMTSLGFHATSPTGYFGTRTPLGSEWSVAVPSMGPEPSASRSIAQSGHARDFQGRIRASSGYGTIKHLIVSRSRPGLFVVRLRS